MSTRETNNARRTICFDDRRLCIEDIVDIAAGAAGVELSAAPAFRARIAAGADFLDRLIKEQGAIYGITTGFGDSCEVTVPPELIAELPRHLYTYHGCGLGEAFTVASDPRRDRHPAGFAMQRVFRRQRRLCSNSSPYSCNGI